MIPSNVIEIESKTGHSTILSSSTPIIYVHHRTKKYGCDDYKHRKQNATE
jgi:hypothetical protein